MDIVKQKCKRVWGRCRRCRAAGTGSGYNIFSKARESLGKSKGCKSPIEEKKKKTQVAPQGCFSVYVGPERERFVMKIELANHPMFKMLLDDAENEYGFRNDGPIWLPCDVNLFCEAVAEMEMENMEEDMSFIGCTFSKSYPSSVMHSPLSYRSNQSYELLSPCTVYA